MLNKNTNCYNIEKNFKYSTVISTFSEHIKFFRTLSIDIWQLKCQQRQTNKTKNSRLFFSVSYSELSNFSSLSFWGKPIKTPINRTSPVFLLLLLVRPFQRVVVFHFVAKFFFLELIFATKIKTMLLKQSAAVLFTSCQKIIEYIMCLNT